MKNITDLPLSDTHSATRFTTLVVMMMSVLASVALGGAIAANGLRTSWVQAIKGHLSIELPAVGGDGTLRTQDELQKNAHALEGALKKVAGIKKIEVLTHAQVSQLVEPWLGAGAGNADLPLPALLSVELTQANDAGAQERITKIVQKIDSAAALETHKSWVADLQHFSLAIMLAALAMAAITVACCIFSVAAGVHARLEGMRHHIDLLHLMGASDGYVAAQFARASVKVVGLAAFGGTLIGFALDKLAGFALAGVGANILPDYQWGVGAYMGFAALPCLITMLCFVAARVSVLRSLQSLP